MQQSLEYIYCKKGNKEDVTVSPFILNRMVSFNNISIASKIDKHIFFRDQEITLEMLKYNLPLYSRVPFLNYIKKPEVEKEEFRFLFDLIKKYFKYSERELNFIKPILLEKFKDKEMLKGFFEFFGVEKKYYKKFDIGLDVKNKTVNIEKWFN